MYYLMCLRLPNHFKFKS